ncbi:Protein of unknown function [Bacillus mycoides]|nr:Protein of unknown function [Bacillus mycoides]
MADKNIGG